WASEAWREVALSGAYSSDYADGFKEGFAEYLYQGGNGEPPVMAPPRYRRIGYQTAEGHRAVEDWFAGYRHGASEAGARGWRQWIVGPSSLQPPADGPFDEHAYPLVRKPAGGKAPAVAGGVEPRGSVVGRTLETPFDCWSASARDPRAPKAGRA